MSGIRHWLKLGNGGALSLEQKYLHTVYLRSLEKMMLVKRCAIVVLEPTSPRPE
ncbi:hypothetical protein [Xanthomonas axonopodis]|uniref:hypothetical protein n=1 Tax=Xanthomonas axonopodis TaxID=53413 RepID=UPI0035586834